MSKNIQATFWAAIALSMVIIGVWVIKTQTGGHAVAGTVAVIHATKVKNTANISNRAEAAPVPAAASTTPVDSTSTPPAMTGKTYRRKPAPKPPIPSYGDMVTQYQNTRIQFDQNCQAHPNQIAIPNPVTLMLDNRSNIEKKIIVGGKSYEVAAYNYVLVILNEKTLPVNLFITCNQQTNVAEIVLQ